MFVGNGASTPNKTIKSKNGSLEVVNDAYNATIFKLTDAGVISNSTWQGDTVTEAYGGTNQSTYAAGDILYASASNTLSKLAKGTDGEVLTLGSGLPSWSSNSATGAWQYISSVTASDDATVVFTSGIDSTYPVYMIQMVDIHPASDDVQLMLRTSTDGGSSYDSGAGNYAYIINAEGPTGKSSVVSASATFIALSAATSRGIGTAAGESYSGQILLYNPSGTVSNKLVQIDSTYVAATGNTCNNYGSGSRIATADVDAIQFLMSSGNISTGVFRLYGLTGA